MPTHHVVACEVPGCPLPFVSQRSWTGRRFSSAEWARSITSKALLPSPCSHEQYNTWNFFNENHLRKFKCHSYEKRFRIETFFSDQKSRGFHIHQSHISDPQRLSRLLIAACLAYIWIVYLGSLCEKEGWGSIIHRSDRCDLSLFQLGLRLLEYVINENLPILVQFYVII